jgi:hypothetical protein
VMILYAHKPLFAWDCLEDSPSRQTLRDLLASLPDAKLLAVHAAFATLLASAPRREGTLGKVRLSPIAEALRAKIKEEAVAAV